MRTISELINLFEEINKLKNKASLNTSQFCSELIKSDNDEYLELHFSLLEKKKRYFQEDLKMYFGFRQNKEKVHHFLKTKIQNSTDEALKKDIDEILLDLGFYYSLEDYKQWIENIKARKRTDKMQFVWKIMKSPYVAYHYEVMKDPELDEDFKRSLQTRFSDHREKAEALLFSKLDNNEDEDFHSEIIFILGRIKNADKSKTLAHARKLAESNDDYTRRMAIIVLGWIGKKADFNLLENYLLNDTDAECRALSACSLWRIAEEIKDQSLKPIIYRIYLKSLSAESNHFTLSYILAMIREMGPTKLGISNIAIDEIDTEKIDLAKPKAIRFLEKALKNN